MSTHLTYSQKQTIRCALAQWAGWAQKENWFERKGGDRERFGIEAIPNYPASLDACIEIEAKLTGEQWGVYLLSLEQITASTLGELPIGCSDAHFGWKASIMLVHAKPWQKSLALYRALNLGELGD